MMEMPFVDVNEKSSWRHLLAQPGTSLKTDKWHFGFTRIGGNGKIPVVATVPGLIAQKSGGSLAIQESHLSTAYLAGK
jgi:hypothetical protein